MAIRILVPGPHIDKSIVRTAGCAAYEEQLAAQLTESFDADLAVS